MAIAAEIRRCAQCHVELPLTATPRRVFCSVACRSRHYDRTNRRPVPAVTLVRLHWHVDPIQILWGVSQAGYWRGDRCPPECDVPLKRPGWSTGVPRDREGLSPVPPTKRKRTPVLSRPTPLRKAPRPPQTAQDGRSAPSGPSGLPPGA